MDFPLILVGLVFVSGLVWLLDALFLAPGRKRMQSELQRQYPQWASEGSADAGNYQAKIAEKAREPVVVEYARSFFPVLFIVFVLLRRKQIAESKDVARTRNLKASILTKKRLKISVIKGEGLR